eukprot:gnl/Chilomastix_caulleri/2155.p1 GENE.gnl/Chilomastix_caulleri/2155~~gnl/Chilomastix_caulleri/2155.p1  ORF type:complete len:182 (+),score=35.58 gnl/Chilomastix_caulleri/2155:54-548(+)
MQIISVLFDDLVHKKSTSIKNVKDATFFPVMPIPIESSTITSYVPFLTAKKFNNTTSTYQFPYEYSTMKQVARVYGTHKIEYIMISSIAYALVDTMGLKGHTKFTISNLVFLKRSSDSSDVEYNSSVSFTSIPVNVVAYRGPCSDSVEHPSNIVENNKILAWCI